MGHGRLRLTPVRLDSKMGLDPDFPTAYRKWGKDQKARATGKMKDSNNSQLTGDYDYEKAAKTKADNT